MLMERGWLGWVQLYFMIRGITKLGILLLLVAAACCSRSSELEITEVERVVNLAGGYPSETIKINFRANEDSISHFTHLIPLEYDSKVAKLGFTKNTKDKSTLAYTRSVIIHDGASFASYSVRLPSNYQIGDEGELTVHLVFINRYINLPASITLSEDQRLQYADTKFIVSPYPIQSQESTYRFAKFIEHDSDGEKKGLGQVNFRAQKAAPFHIVRHTVFGVNNNPQVVFTSVEKTIELSHWGNVGITESYKMVNTGPTLKGEFSRVTYGSRSQADARNAYKGIEFDLPYEIWGLYYQDEVGNISTSKAWRDDSSRSVHVALQPRFALLGGWKSNWQLGYNLNTNDGHLFHENNKFELRNVKLEYALEKIIAEEFTIKFILPHGAENVRITIGGKDYDMGLVEKSVSEGYLDFQGRPTYVIGNYQGVLKDKNIQVFYDFNPTAVYEKPIALFVIVLAFLLFAIFAKRFQLHAFTDSKRSD